MGTTSPEPIPPIRLEGIVPGTLNLKRSAAQPNEVILSAQVKLDPSPDLFTLVLHLGPAEARRLVTQLQGELCPNCSCLTSGPVAKARHFPAGKAPREN